MSTGDPQIDRLVAQVQQQQQIQSIIHDLTEKCWDTCVDRPGKKLEPKTQNCLKNCVQRYIDANIAVTQNLDKKAMEVMQNHDNLGLQ